MRVEARELFRHVSAEKSALYRAIMDAFATAKRQFRLHLRPDEVLSEAEWTEVPPKIEEVQAALAQLTEWGNLKSQPDTARVASISDFYRARFLYRLSEGGEAVEFGSWPVCAGPQTARGIAERGARRHRQSTASAAAAGQ